MMGKKKKEEPKVVSVLKIELMDDGKFQFTTEGVPGWALQAFLQLFTSALSAKQEG